MMWLMPCHLLHSAPPPPISQTQLFCVLPQLLVPPVNTALIWPLSLKSCFWEVGGSLKGQRMSCRCPLWIIRTRENPYLSHWLCLCVCVCAGTPVVCPAHVCVLSLFSLSLLIITGLRARISLSAGQPCHISSKQAPSLQKALDNSP